MKIDDLQWLEEWRSIDSQIAELDVINIIVNKTITFLRSSTNTIGPEENSQSHLFLRVTTELFTALLQHLPLADAEELLAFVNKDDTTLHRMLYILWQIPQYHHELIRLLCHRMHRWLKVPLDVELFPLYSELLDFSAALAGVQGSLYAFTEEK